MLTEEIVIGIVSGALGCGLTDLAFAYLPHVTNALSPLALALVISGRIMANSLLVATLIGAASTSIPAALATRGDI